MKNDKPKIFPDGFNYYEPRAGAPDFVMGNIVIDITRFSNFMVKSQTGEKLRLVIKRAKSGNIYTEVDLYDPTGKAPRSKEEEDTQIQYPESEKEISIDDVVDNF